MNAGVASSPFVVVMLLLCSIPPSSENFLFDFGRMWLKMFGSAIIKNVIEGCGGGRHRGADASHG